MKVGWAVRWRGVRVRDVPWVGGSHEASRIETLTLDFRVAARAHMRKSTAVRSPRLENTATLPDT